MLRYLGAAALVLSSWIVGVLLARAEKDTPRAIYALYNLASFLLRQIKNGRTPLRVLFDRYSDPYLERVGFLNVLRSGGDIPALWREALELLPIDGTAKEESVAFGAELGLLPLEQQEKRLESYMLLLQTEREKAESGIANRQKSIRAVCLLLGALMAIILI